MHILFTANTCWNILNFRKPLIDSMIAEGHTVTVLAPRDSSVDELAEMGCRFVHLIMDVKGLSPVRDYLFLLRLRRHFREISPNLVCSFTIKNNIFGALAAKGLPLGFIPNVTGLGTAFLSSFVLQRIAEGLYRRAFHKIPVVFFQNEDDRALFLSRNLVTNKQARLLPGSGIDVDRFNSTPLPQDATYRFLMISRLLRDKGVVEFVEAAQKVSKRHPSVRFQLLGPLGTDNRSAISSDTLEEWRSSGVIEYLGESDDVRREISAADCVVLSSYREGAPRTLIEAAAMGRPLIATDVPGCRAVVDDGKTGFLCAPRDSDALADACERMLALEGSDRAELGRQGRQKMEREFHQDVIVDAYRSAMASIAADEAPRASGG
ncbi:glycosyltransferase family 4 protein [Tranquillimonas rosea]|uniref:glycosyltransferase family 4 protein n=1 Tax=Tranquillimonas rosea TaxID=641238 RepID=UPI003BAA1887